MNHEDKIEKIRNAKKYFFVSFIISFIFIMFATLMCILFQDAQIHVMEKFFEFEADDYGLILMMVFGLWKILIIQFTLIPAIALAIIEKNCCCKK